MQTTNASQLKGRKREKDTEWLTFRLASKKRLTLIISVVEVNSLNGDGCYFLPYTVL